jgi:capsular exopolysaccharide synthesis family protein
VADNHSLNPASESDFGYGQLLSILLRRSRCFIGTLSLILAAAALLTLRQDPVYRSSMQLLVEPNYEQQLKATEKAPTVSQTDYATQLNLMKSRQFLEKTVDLLKAEYPDLGVESMRSSLELSQLEGTKIFQAVYLNDDPVKTQRVLETLQQIYQQYNLEQQEQRLKRGLASLNGQLQVVRQDLSQSQTALQEFRQRQNLIDPQQQAAAVANSLNQLIQEQQALRAQYQEVQARYATLQQQLGLSPSDALIATRLSQSSRYQALLNQLQQTELALAQRRVIFSDADPSVQALLDQRQNQLGLLHEEIEHVLGEIPQQFINPQTALPPAASASDASEDTSEATPPSNLDRRTDESPESPAPEAAPPVSPAPEAAPPVSPAPEAAPPATASATAAPPDVTQETPAPSAQTNETALLSNGQLGNLDLSLVSALADAQSTLSGLEARQSSLQQTEQWLRTELNRYPDLIAEYDRLQPSVDIDRAVLEQLLQQRQEVSAELARGGFNWQVVEQPTVGKKISPKPKQNMLLGLVVGLFLGGVVALVREGMDEVIRTPDDLRKHTHEPLLGGLPIFQQSGRSIPLLPLHRSLSEQLTLVQILQKPLFRESIDLIYKNIQLLGRSKRLNSILVTSAQSDEGKSTLAFGLAVSAARLHQRVLFIDANLRHPTLHLELGLANEHGLSVLLERHDTLPSPVPLSLADFRFDVLPAGPKPVDPVRLLSSPRMKELMALFESTYDLVIVDTSPLVGIVDALQVASVCSGTILIGRLNHVTQSALQQATTMVSSLNLLGVVANGSHSHPLDYTPSPNGHRELSSRDLQILKN